MYILRHNLQYINIYIYGEREIERQRCVCVCDRHTYINIINGVRNDVIVYGKHPMTSYRHQKYELKFIFKYSNTQSEI